MPLQKIKFNNVGPLQALEWDNLEGLNVILGNNASGKTFLLKTLFASLKALEDAQGKEQRSLKQLIEHRLQWTFQLPLKENKKETAVQFKELITYKQESLSVALTNENQETVDYRLTPQGVEQMHDRWKNKQPSRCIFLPAKEVLFLAPFVQQQKLAKEYSLDDTYHELIKAIQILPPVGSNNTVFRAYPKKLEESF
ncbi:MAG: hypothetical protein ACKO34_02965 [Vampirovibrionales bacterium]